MMVGAAFLTIKTAGLLWFIYGSLQRDEGAVPDANSIASSKDRWGYRTRSRAQRDFGRRTDAAHAT